ncbi:peroxisomal ATPase PEX6-like isoform X2 [Coffea arabica]|uniref:Peroxisomal ATPase PEX6 n=1 Tax=Coffea arabica TaxID=13443 RepID=A0A6P6WNI2_COFAR|nr:peroxisome biogenesis protein 6-like isoform X2 [Coffea arabica]
MTTVERRRKPLVLSSTRALVDSVLSCSRIQERDDVNDDGKIGTQDPQDSQPNLQLKAGILRISDNPTDNSQATTKLASLDRSALLGLSTSTLKKLSITSGSLVRVQNADNNFHRIAQIVALDAPFLDENLPDNQVLKSHSPQTMLLFPSCDYPQNRCIQLDPDVAYLSPILLFNLYLHVSCLKSIVHQGKEAISSLFECQLDGEGNCKANNTSAISLAIKPSTHSPQYASHLRAAFVRIPECNTLESLKRSRYVEDECRQELIDVELNNYFTVDRFLSTGDLFSISINWNCRSALCICCSRQKKKGTNDMIYFKVVAMEPSEAPVLRVNRTQTALVLGGNVASAVLPAMLIRGLNVSIPVQQNVVKMLASILSPPLCPSALSSKFRVAVLLHGLRGCGKRTIVKYVAHQLGLHVVEYSCHNLVASSERKTSAALAQAFSTGNRYSPIVVLLRHFDIFQDLAHEASPHEQLGVNSEIAAVIKKFTEPVIEDEDDQSGGRLDCHSTDSEQIYRHRLLLVATADRTEGLPPTIRRCFSHEISMGPLTEEQRIQMLSGSLRRVAELLPNNSLEDLVQEIVRQTSGFMPRDLQALIADAAVNLVSSHPPEKAQKNSFESEQFEDCKSTSATRDMGKEDLLKALEQSKKRNASALGTPKVPDVKWEDVGGLEDVKKSILDTVQLPLLHKDLFSSGLRKRSGVLLYGPPGTGKTLLAKAVATECSLNFLSVKGPELINMYIGESEKNVRDIFEKARSARPCVIFFDELDSLAPARGASGDSGGVMDRVVSQMLAEIDGLNDSSQELFIIGASNRPDLIDPALLRPGRFDKLLYVGVNSETSYRERVLKALTRKFKLHEDVSLQSIAKRCPPNFTGADMYALCADAWFHAAKQKVLVAGADSSSLNDRTDSVVVQYVDFIKVLGELSPSLSIAELKKYELLRDQFEGASR